MARSYRDLLVWQKAKALAVLVYQQTESFPKSEMYGLNSQIRRAAVSVSSNMAEGQGRLTRGEFAHFLWFGERVASRTRDATLDRTRLGIPRCGSLREI